MITRNFNFTENIYIDPKEIASEFCDMSSKEQALFFNEVALLVKTWGCGAFPFQMQALLEEESLTPEARHIMRTIGEYGEVS